jgi:G3E family GTPase
MTTRLLIIGGFLGAGKTTLLLQAARLLSGQGYRVGLITNDQGQDLVDTALAAHQEIPVTEVAGGCFCCRFPDMIKALRRLQETVAPDVILAEPVGSCTDLVATIIRPLGHYYADQYLIAPLTILLDAGRKPTEFSNTINYLYRKQLAEADIIALNKVDLLEPDQRQQRLAALATEYPQSSLISFSAQTGAGVDAWLETCLSQVSPADRLLELNYATYAAAEAELGWLNAKGTIVAAEPFEAGRWIADLLDRLKQELAARAASIAHIKISLTTPSAALKASLIGSEPSISWDLPGPVMTDRGLFLLNARVSIEPRQLEQIVRAALAEIRPYPDFRCDLTHFECFSPLPPEPTFRFGPDNTPPNVEIAFNR